MIYAVKAALTGVYASLQTEDFLEKERPEIVSIARVSRNVFAPKHIKASLK